MVDIRRLPAPTPEEWEWPSKGACRDADVTQFFHPDFERGADRDRRAAAAKAVCARCPVQQQCRDYALTVGEAYGTWGGLDEIERRALITRLRPGGVPSTTAKSIC